jgi:hypothetical protein
VNFAKYVITTVEGTEKTFKTFVDFSRRFFLGKKEFCHSMLFVPHTIGRLHCEALLLWHCLSEFFTDSCKMLETSNLFLLKAQIYNVIVVRKEPMYIPAICLEELGETMEADNREEI